MTKELIIAAYDKPLDWLENINKDVKISIYRKGNLPKSNFQEIQIEPNVGRCVHTFFNHIYHNYNNLSDITFFAQDYPFDHWGNIVDTINNNLWIKNCRLNINNGYFGFNNTTVGHHHEFSKSIQFANNIRYYQNITNPPSLIDNIGDVLICYSNGYPHDTRFGDNLNVDKYWEMLFTNPKPPVYEFMPAGHIGLTKQQIQIRSKNFYLKIKHYLENDFYSPWVIERLECYIFDERFLEKTN